MAAASPPGPAPMMSTRFAIKVPLRFADWGAMIGFTAHFLWS